MKHVSEILDTKGSEIWSVAPTTPVYKALELMSEKNCGAVLVMDDRRLVGIMSERDYARKVILMGKASKNIPVEEIMSKEVVCVEPPQTVDDCMTLMTQKRLRHLPVIDEQSNVVGVISIGDVVKEIISEQENTIHELENYITSPE